MTSDKFLQDKPVSGSLEDLRRLRDLDRERKFLTPAQKAAHRAGHQPPQAASVTDPT